MHFLPERILSEITTKRKLQACITYTKHRTTFIRHQIQLTALLLERVIRMKLKVHRQQQEPTRFGSFYQNRTSGEAAGIIYINLSIYLIKM